MTSLPTPLVHVPTEVTEAMAKYEPWLKLVGNTGATTAPPTTTVDPDTGATTTAPSFLDALRAIPTEKEYKRPNGLIYVPRAMAVADKTTVQDVVFVKAAYAKRRPILFYGDPGTGKTALVEASLPGL